MMADMEVDKVADMVADKEVDKVADMVADKEVGKVADMVADKKMTLTSASTWKSNLVRELVNWALTCASSIALRVYSSTFPWSPFLLSPMQCMDVGKERQFTHYH